MMRRRIYWWILELFNVQEGQMIPWYLVPVRVILFPRDLFIYLNPSIYRSIRENAIIVDGESISYLLLSTIGGLEECERLILTRYAGQLIVKYERE